MLLAVTLGANSVWLSSQRSVWSPDSGALLCMAKSFARGDSPAYPAYPLQNLDPDWELHPLLGAGYVAMASRGHALVYGPALAVISGSCYRVLGFAGLALPMLI